jgi:hypothetical protein
MDAAAAMGTSRKAAYKRFCFVGTIYPSEVRNSLESSAYLTYMARRRQRRSTSLFTWRTIHSPWAKRVLQFHEFRPSYSFSTEKWMVWDHGFLIMRSALKHAMRW